MDFERIALKGLLYDYPLHLFVDNVINGKSLVESLPDVLKWSAREYSSSELNGVIDLINRDWSRNKGLSSGFVSLLMHLSDEFLTHKSGRQIEVKFKHYLRWCNLSRFIGEEALVSAFYANNSLSDELIIWPEVLEHNCKSINKVLNQGLSDVHCHLNAYWDAFGLSWIRLMNLDDSVTDENFKKALESANRDLELSSIMAESQHVLGMFHFLKCAQIIRFYLFYVCFIDDSDYTQIIDTFRKVVLDESQSTEQLEQVEGVLEPYREGNSFEFDGLKWDYAIRKEDINNLTMKNRKQPSCLYLGERQIMIKFFEKLLADEQKYNIFVPYYHLYLLIKNKIRKCLIQTNGLCGLENFQEFNSKKGTLAHVAPGLKRKYSIFTAIKPNLKNKVEGRLTLDEIKRWSNQNWSCFISSEDFFSKPLFGHLSYVCTLGKNDENNYKNRSRTTSKIRNSRYEINRKRSYEGASKIINSNLQISGVDVCGNELFAPPEVFAHPYRFLVESNSRLRDKLTYHVGECYYDLVDGIRRIDEALMFLPLLDGCRIGHAVALGIDSLEYYNARHFSSIAPAQVILDNLVWLARKAKKIGVTLPTEIESIIEENTIILYEQIGYKNKLNKSYKDDSYWNSMLLRGDDINSKEYSTNDKWESTQLSKHSLADVARKDELAKLIHEVYEKDSEIISNGSNSYVLKWPKCIIKIISKIQEKMRDEISNKGLAIECCPTSNLLITQLNRYASHPILNFCSIGGAKNKIKVSINTDDSGIFATSLYREYSLMGLALLKEDLSQYKINKQQQFGEVQAFLSSVSVMSNDMRF